MRELTESLVAVGYEEKSSAREIWNQYRGGGMEAVESYAANLIGSANLEDVDIDF